MKEGGKLAQHGINKYVAIISKHNQHFTSLLASVCFPQVEVGCKKAKNRHDVNKKMHLDIDLLSISVACGSQVGRILAPESIQNRTGGLGSARWVWLMRQLAEL